VNSKRKRKIDEKSDQPIAHLQIMKKIKSEKQNEKVLL